MATVIVAIPANDDPVWKLSSEKIPHLTLLYLADSVDPEKLSGLVQHIAENCMTRPGLSVDRRGTLGPDNADVLFFDKKSYWCQDFAEIRRWLLTDPEVFTAFNSVDQYPSWTPHLTVGYPESPAHDDKVEFSSTWVRFDRLAIWYGDFEGPEFEIDDNQMELAMSDDISNFLMHFGVKGMKWGVRKNVDGSDSTSGVGNYRPSRISKDRELNKGKDAAAQAYEKELKGRLKKIDDQEYSEKQTAIKGIIKNSKNPKNLDSSDKALIDSKRKELTKKYDKLRQEAIDKKTKTRQELDAAKLAAFDSSERRARREKLLDEFLSFGIFTGVFKGTFDLLTHEDDTEDFLTHHGIKGMKWGVRRTDEQLGNPDGGANGVKSPSGVDVVISKAATGPDGKLSRREKKELIKAAEQARKVGPQPERDIDHPSDIKLSVDAERFVRTRLKEGHEMSNQEIREAIQRKENVDRYTKMFEPDANKVLRDRLENLELQKKIREVDAELNPAKVSAAKQLIRGVTKGYEFYQNLPGPIRGGIEKKMATVFDPQAARKLAEEAASAAASKKRKEDRDELKADLEIQKLRKQLDESTGSKGDKSSKSNRSDSNQASTKSEQKSDNTSSTTTSRSSDPNSPSERALRLRQKASTQVLRDNETIRETTTYIQNSIDQRRKVAEKLSKLPARSAERIPLERSLDNYDRAIGKWETQRRAAYKSRDEADDRRVRSDEIFRRQRSLGHSDLEDFFQHHASKRSRKSILSGIVENLMQRSSDV